jgi:ABC-2 type transport system ATP-binding protein
MIETKNLSKSFGIVHAVRQMNLTVHSGEIYGLVGSDGAGKTTTLRLLVGALRPDSGQVSICGYSIDRQVEQARAQIGYLSQRFSMYEDLTVLENIRFFAEVRGLTRGDWLPRSLEILEFVGLAAFKDRKAGQLSGGMKQKLGLASALVTQPSVLLLDEPTTGVDPVTRQDFWQLLVKLVSQPANQTKAVAVILTTPYMDEAARCNRIGFMRQGELIAEGTPSQMRARLNGRILELRGNPLREMSKVAARDPGVEDVRLFGDRLHLRTRAGHSFEVQKRLQGSIPRSGVKLDSIDSVPAGLEDVFIALSETETKISASLLDLPEAHSRALAFLIQRIPPGEYGWVLTGSTSLRLRGVDVPVHDLDIECRPGDIHRIEQALAEFIKTPVHLVETSRIRSRKGKAEVEGLEVEIMTDLEVEQENGPRQNLVDFEHCTWLEWQGQRVPVLPLQDEAATYEAMGRLEKSRLIRTAIQNSKESQNV